MDGSGRRGGAADSAELKTIKKDKKREGEV